MRDRGGRLVHLVRYLMIGALIIINVVLVGLNLQKHAIFPYTEDGEADEAASRATASAEASDAADTVDGADVGAGAGSPDVSAIAEAVSAETADDWPGGRGPVPDGPPLPRTVLLGADGSARLSGSVPSWAVATEIAERVAARLGAGPASSPVTIEYSWHPEAPADPQGGVVRLDPPVLHGAGQVAVPAEAEASLQAVVDLLAGHPAVFIIVVGHIDDLGDSTENATVAAARITEVVSRLEAEGVDPSRMVMVIAPADPQAPPNDDEQGRAFNRRVDIEFENFLAPALIG